MTKDNAMANGQPQASASFHKNWRSGLISRSLAMTLLLGGTAFAEDVAPPPDAQAAAPVADAPTQASVPAKKAALKARKTRFSALGKDQPQAGARQGQRYFVEFRSRYALSYGHTFLAYGRLNEKGQIIERTIAGLHPTGENATWWTVGHLVPVVSETGPSDGDLEDEYISARYRVTMDEREYQRVVAFIKYRQTNSPLWHAVLYNCSAWVGDIAKFMGLRTPANTLQYPKNYINGIRDMNVGNNRAGAASLAESQ